MAERVVVVVGGALGVGGIAVLGAPALAYWWALVLGGTGAGLVLLGIIILPEGDKVIPAAHFGICLLLAVIALGVGIAAAVSYHDSAGQGDQVFDKLDH